MAAIRHYNDIRMESGACRLREGGWEEKRGGGEGTASAYGRSARLGG